MAVVVSSAQEKAPDAQERLKSVRVATRSSLQTNKTVTVWYRVPEGFDPVQRDRLWRVLVVFGGKNVSGKREVDGGAGLEWGKWADEQGVFLVSPGFVDDNYWNPQPWSGRALFDALALIKKQYPVCDTKLLYYGHSAGSQCANLFAAWRPDAVRAWVSHGCGIFYKPSVAMKGVPGLVTCGEADTARCITSRRFVQQCLRQGQDIIWRSYPNSPHNVPKESLKLARAVLTHYHTTHLSDLQPTRLAAGPGARRTEAPSPAPFVGDDADHTYYPAGSAKAVAISPVDRVALPTEDIAKAWGEEGERNSE